MSARRANEANEKTVLAIGDSGTLEPTMTSKAVDIGCIPLGACNEKIPGTVRYWAAKNDGEGIPTRVRRIGWPTQKNGQRYAYLEFDCTPFVRYTLDSGPVYGHWQSCCVRNMHDAADSIFSGLTSMERKRIERAARISELHSRA